MTSVDPFTDPGTEVIDHDGDGAVTDLLAVRTFAGGASSDAARASAWSDYAWATWLPGVLHAAGVPYLVEPGFATRGRPRSVGPFLPAGVMWHHDASPVGPSPSMADFIGLVGRPAEGIPAPLSQVWVCVGCKGAHAVGTWHLLAAGRANHAGSGSWGDVPTDAGNTRLIGLEVDHTTGEAWPDALVESLVWGTAAIFDHLNTSPARWLMGHKEYAHGRKVDPDRLDMAAMRDRVRSTVSELRTGTKMDDGRALEPFPGPAAFRPGVSSPSVLRLEKWLKVLDRLPETHKIGHTFTPATRNAVREFQQRHPRLRADADGFPGPLTWELLQRAVREARTEDR